ncbi:MAG: CinA family nicotinamide mononucleotide deamidase-related protein [Chitinophagaceae bacterium]|nr:CinA family nicotinamide mononucleotide deamidase-related protein [Chitinophagaceae bacterium]
MTNCSIITIGDELLIGQTIDTNSAWLGVELNKIGIAVRKRIAVGDDEKEITDTLLEEEKTSNLIIITGGLGPTNDDITKSILVKFFNTKLILFPEILNHVEAFFIKRNRPFLETNKQQAYLPNNCIPLFNELGTAPGMWFEKNNVIYISLPGVPFEMKNIMLSSGFEKIKNFFKPNIITHHTILTSGEGESFLAERLTDFEKDLPQEIKLAYLPHLGNVKLRLSAYQDFEQEILVQKQKLIPLVGNAYVIDKDVSLNEYIFELLKQRNETISTAESCTGGAIASILTSIKGSSAIFEGSIICYSADAKNKLLDIEKEFIEKNSVVSEATSLALAKHCLEKLNTTYAIGITGYLEKGDAQNQICIAVCNHERSVVKTFYALSDRARNTDYAVTFSLNLLRKFILNLS